MHISEYDWKRTDSLENLLHEGDTVQVKIIAIDEKTGKLKLSRKALLPKPEGYEEEPRNAGGNNGRGPRRDNGNRGPRHEGNGPRHDDRRRSGNGGERRR